MDLLHGLRRGQDPIAWCCPADCRTADAGALPPRPRQAV